MVTRRTSTLPSGEESWRASLSERLQAALEATRSVEIRGSIQATQGLLLRAKMPRVLLGELVEVHSSRRTFLAEVVGFSERGVELAPLDAPLGVAPGDLVVAMGRMSQAPDPAVALGRMIDATGAVLDGAPLAPCSWVPVRAAAPSPSERTMSKEPWFTGLRALDVLAPLSLGQRVGVFAGSGAGKSSLLVELLRNAEADVRVIALIGERGREVPWVREALPQELRARSVLVVETADAAPARRVLAALTAMTLAESLRARGARVLLVMDSLTRWARAKREVALARGEAPSRRGYPPSVLSELSQLVERAGGDSHGSMTAVFSVLMESDELEDPIADEARSCLDAHWVLERERLAQGYSPPLDPVASRSRLTSTWLTVEQRELSERLRALLATMEQHAQAWRLGALVPGRDPLVDEAFARRSALEGFMRQPLGSPCTGAQAWAQARAVLGRS